ncbi:hypothetical protein Aduo_017463 [Ancylostoma duodenale]
MSLCSFVQKCVCTRWPCITEKRKWGGVLRNADYVLFVSAQDTGSCVSGNALAFAMFCDVEQTTSRPIAGFANICPWALRRDQPGHFYMWRSTLKHELMHALIFTPILYPYYQAATGPPISEGKLKIVPGVFERFERLEWETAKGYVSHDVYMIVSPRVREEARKFFNCPDLEGAELESQGGGGSAFAHWEKRIFEEEGMCAVATTYNSFSRITLALFEDSGWYKVNYKCSANRKGKLRCNMIRGAKGLPAHFDYSTPNLYKDKKGRPIQGRGLITFADYCPYYWMKSTHLKKGSYDTRCTLPDNMNYNKYSLEIFSPSSRCFELEGGIAVQYEHNTDIWLHTVGCYETKCEEGLLFVKTQKSKFYPCYKRGQLVHVEKRLPGIGTVRTKIVCPSCAELCGEQFCQPERTVMQRIGDSSKNPFSSFIASFLLYFLVYFFIVHCYLCPGGLR